VTEQVIGVPAGGIDEALPRCGIYASVFLDSETHLAGEFAFDLVLVLERCKGAPFALDALPLQRREEMCFFLSVVIAIGKRTHEIDEL
jgi:hypothetical protein